MYNTAAMLVMYITSLGVLLCMSICSMLDFWRCNCIELWDLTAVYVMGLQGAYAR